MRGEVELLKQKQEDKFSTSLKKAYSDTYYTTNKHIADSVDYAVNFAKFDRDTVKNAIYEKWLDGSNFSDRIWNDKQKLLRELNTNLVQGITRGDSPDKMIKNISSRMNVSKSRAAALYQTEYTHIMVDARLQSLKDAGFEEYEIDENMDSDICKECKEWHGKHFKLSEYQQGVTAPPFHTRCRGTISAYFPDEIFGDKSDELDKLLNQDDKKVDNSGRSDIIKSITKAANSAVRNTGKTLKYNADKDFSIKLDRYSGEVNSGLSKATARVAALGGKTEKEHMILVDLETGKFLYQENGDSISVGGSDFKKFIKENKDKSIAFVHNHNTDGYFSETDMRTLLTTPNIKIFIATRIDGVTYVAEKIKEYPGKITFDSMYEKQLHSINQQARQGLITAGERTHYREEIIVDNLLKDYTNGLEEFNDGRRLGKGNA